MGICLSVPVTELKKSSFEVIGEFVVGKSSCLRAEEDEKALAKAGRDLESSDRIMVGRERV